MKYFAVTPDDLNPARLINCLQALKKKSVTHLYLRAQSLHAELEQLIDLIRHHAILPIIPRNVYQTAFESACGIHTRSDEVFNTNLHSGARVQTASCHTAQTACTLLDKGANYVFISPVYRPFSKSGDLRPLIEHNDLRKLSKHYGERIVLLGGLTPVRIKELHGMLSTDFSVAGISMFFNTGTTHEQNSNTNIHQ